MVFRLPACTAIYMMGVASASTLLTTGSSISSGMKRRARETLSRTSAAAASGSRSILNLMLIQLRSERLRDVMTSTPSIPES